MNRITCVAAALLLAACVGGAPPPSTPSKGTAIWQIAHASTTSGKG